MPEILALGIDDGSARAAIRRIRVASGQPFAGKQGDRVLAAVRRAIGEEFDRGAERTDGGFRPWPKTNAFGRRPATRPPLGGRGGSLGSAWQGGAGGFSRVRPTEIQLGVRLPGAAIHRGDLGPQVAIKAKKRGARGLPAMFWALGLGFGVWLSPERLRARGVTIPARPHARATASLASIVAEALTLTSRT